VAQGSQLPGSGRQESPRVGPLFAGGSRLDTKASPRVVQAAAEASAHYRVCGAGGVGGGDPARQHFESPERRPRVEDSRHAECLSQESNRTRPGVKARLSDQKSLMHSSLSCRALDSMRRVSLASKSSRLLDESSDFSRSARSSASLWETSPTLSSRTQRTAGRSPLEFSASPSSLQSGPGMLVGGFDRYLAGLAMDQCSQDANDCCGGSFEDTTRDRSSYMMSGVSEYLEARVRNSHHDASEILDSLQEVSRRFRASIAEESLQESLLSVGPYMDTENGPVVAMKSTPGTPLSTLLSPFQDGSRLERSVASIQATPGRSTADNLSLLSSSSFIEVMETPLQPPKHYPVVSPVPIVDASVPVTWGRANYCGHQRREGPVLRQLQVHM